MAVYEHDVGTSIIAIGAQFQLFFFIFRFFPHAFPQHNQSELKLDSSSFHPFLYNHFSYFKC